MIKPSFIIALVCLLVLVLAGFFLIQGDRPPVEVGKARGKLLADLNQDSVKSIDIKKGDVDVKLEKKGGGDWILSSNKNRLAKTDRVKSLLTALTSANITDSRPGSEEKFDLDKDHVTELVLHREAGDKKVYLGKSIEYGQSSFVRQENDKTVYEIDKGIDTDAGIRTEGTEGADKKEKRILDPAYFYDLKIFSISNDDIIDVAIKKGHDTIRVQRVIPGKGPLQPKQEIGKDDPKPIWWITEPEGMEANEATLNSICSNLSSLNAKNYADKIPEKDLGLDKPAAKVKLRLKDGTEQTLTFGKVDNDEVVMSVSGKSDPYKVYKYVLDTVAKDYADFKKKDEEKKDAKPADNTGITIPPTGPNPPPIPPSVHAPKNELPQAKVPQPPTKVEPPPPITPPAVVKPQEEKNEKK